MIQAPSAGTHLAARLTVSPDMAFKLGVKPWLGTILLGSAAFDMIKIIEAEHACLYDFPFGNDSAYWRATSPFHVLSEIAISFLVVCSTRHTDSCSQAAQFITEAESLNVHASALEQNLFHKNINLQLGLKAVIRIRLNHSWGGLMRL